MIPAFDATDETAIGVGLLNVNGYLGTVTENGEVVLEDEHPEDEYLAEQLCDGGRATRFGVPPARSRRRRIRPSTRCSLKAAPARLTHSFKAFPHGYWC